MYPLLAHHSTTRYNIPYLIDKPGSGNNIHGEVYEVDEKMLKNLDILEDHPNYYQRRPEKVSLQNVGKTEGLCLNAKNSSSKIDLVSDAECWIYILNKYKEEMLRLPMLSVYRSEDDHGRAYVPRSEREHLSNYYGDVMSQDL